MNNLEIVLNEHRKAQEKQDRFIPIAPICDAYFKYDSQHFTKIARDYLYFGEVVDE